MRIDLSPNDKRLYRHVTLNNGFSVVLVSGNDSVNGDSSQSQKPACALTVPMGYFSDPTEAVGLSDLIRRTLVQEIQNDLHGDDRIDAYTSNEWSTFYFEVEPKRLESTLDVFVRRLCHPKLDQNHIASQLNFMEQDYKKSLSKNEMNLRHFISKLATPGSPFSNVQKGCRRTLLNEEKRSLPSLRSMMLQHLAGCLDPQQMTFAAESATETLDELEVMIQQHLLKFTSKKAKRVSRVNPGPCFENAEFHKFYEIVTPSTREQLRLIWTLPCVQSSYRSNPIYVLGSLIRNLQEGGIASYLEDEHLATDLDCVFGTLCDFLNSSVCTLVTIRMNLTQAGISRVQTICEHIYDYLKFLVAEAAKCLYEPNGYNRSSFLLEDGKHTFRTYVHELQILREADFMGQPILPAQVTAVWLASMMRKVDSRDLYSGYQLIKDPDMSVYHELLTHLATHRCCIIRTSHELESNGGALKTVPYYPIKYRESDYPESVIQVIQNPNRSLNFSLPAKNRAAVELFPNLPCSNNFKSPENLNANVERSRFSVYGALWYQSLTFFEPSRGAILLQISSQTPLQSVRNSNLLMLFVEHMRRNIATMHSANYAEGMSYKVSTLDTNIYLTVNGPGENLERYYSLLTTRAFELCTEMDLEQLDERLKRGQACIEQSLVSPEKLTDNLLQYLTKRTAFLLSDQLEDFPQITIADLMAFNSQVLCQLSLNAYVVGTISQEEARSMYDHTVRVITCIPALKKRENSTLYLDPGTYHYRLDSPFEDSDVCHFVRYNLCLSTDSFAEAMNRTLVELFEKYFCAFLSTEESSKACVTIKLRRVLPGPKGHSVIQLCVQTTDAARIEEYCRPRTAAFWYKIAPLLIASLGDTDLQELRSAVTNKLRAICWDPAKLVDTLWETVVEWDSDFKFVEKILDNLSCMTRDDLFNFFFDNYLNPVQQRTIVMEITTNGTKRRKLDRSFRLPMFRSKQQLDEEIAKFLSAHQIDANAAALYKEQFRKINSAYPEHMSTIRDLRAFRDQRLSQQE